MDTKSVPGAAPDGSAAAARLGRPLWQVPDAEPGPDGLPGWAKTAVEGAFDTMLAMHAINETADFKLEIVCNHVLGVDRWDLGVQKCKKDACKDKAVGSDGKALAGAAKKSFLQKCEKDA